MTQNNNINQLVKVSKALQDIKINVSAQDRKEAQKDMNVTKELIGRYLNGHGTNLDTATRLLSYLRKCVAKREKLVA